MKFEIGELAILNEKATSGLPDRVGEVVEVVTPALLSPNYDYYVELDNGDFVPVREKELNHLTMPELDLITYIKRGNKVLFAVMEQEVEIVKVDYLHGQAEVKFYDSAMSIIGFEQLRPIDYKEGELLLDEYEYEEENMKQEPKFKIEDKVKTLVDDHWGGKLGIVSGWGYFDNGAIEYQVDIGDKIGVPFAEHELELASSESVNKQMYFDLLFGHFENEDGNYVVPKQLLHNLLNKIL